MKKTVKKSAARPAMKSKPAAKPMMRKGGLTKYQKKGENDEIREMLKGLNLRPQPLQNPMGEFARINGLDRYGRDVSYASPRYGMIGPPTEEEADLTEQFYKKKGGSTKAKKFAALAPPYDKATAADRIAGAKKSKSKSKKK